GRLRDVDVTNVASGAGSHHCGKERERAIRGTGVDADARVFGHVREAVLVSRDGYLPGPRVVRDPVARHVLVRTGGSISRDRAEHDARVHYAQVVVPESPVGERAGSIASMTASAPRTRSR